MALNLLEKSDILTKLDNGMRGSSLAKKYNVSRQAISYIKKHKSDILKAIEANFDNVENSERLMRSKCNNSGDDEIELDDHNEVIQKEEEEVSSDTDDCDGDDKIAHEKEEMDFSDSDDCNEDTEIVSEKEQEEEEEEEMASKYSSTNDDDDYDSSGDDNSSESGESQSDGDESVSQSDDDIDPNVLCERLRILTRFNNTDFINQCKEIQSIISELRAANIIY